MLRPIFCLPTTKRRGGSCRPRKGDSLNPLYKSSLICIWATHRPSHLNNPTRSIYSNFCHYYLHMASQNITYLAGGPDGKIRAKTSVRSIGGLEVLVRITHSGVCGTDDHDRVDGCGLGHEGIGIVEKIGQDVTTIKVGQRVGSGYVVETQSKPHRAVQLTRVPGGKWEYERPCITVFPPSPYVQYAKTVK